jgi:hypothetical protein
VTGAGRLNGCLRPEDELRVLARAAVLSEITFRTESCGEYSLVWVQLLSLVASLPYGPEGERPGLMAQVYSLRQLYFSWLPMPILWLNQNLKLERSVRDALENHDKALRIQACIDEVGGPCLVPTKKDLGV